MKKTLSESELKELAQGVFEQFPNAKEVYATSDGNIFLSENRANLHAGKDGNVYPFKREEKAAVETQLKAVDAVAKIQAATSMEELEAFKTDERKSVKEAFDKKALELTKPGE